VRRSAAVAEPALSSQVAATFTGRYRRTGGPICEFISKSVLPIHFTLLCLLGLFSVSGCDLDRDEGILMAAGSYGDLAVVVSDDDLRPLARPFLERLNAPVTFVIREESPYNIDVYGPAKWKLCRGYKNILFLVRWGDGGVVERKVADLTSPETLARMKEGQVGLVQRNDPFARYQFGLFVTAVDRNSLASLLNNNLDLIARLLEEQIRERIQRRFRHTGLQDELMTRYWQQYEFFMEIPREYRQNQVEPDGYPGIEWMQNAPSRGVTLAWRKAGDPTAALRDRDLLLAWRQEIGQAMHNEDIVDAGLTWSDADLGGLKCAKLEGSWASRVIDGGGPFRCYFIPDSERGRLFCLDTLVFSPGENKLPYFREMEAIAATFSLQRPHP